MVCDSGGRRAPISQLQRLEDVENLHSILADPESVVVMIEYILNV